MKGTTKCFRCGKETFKTSIRGNRPELCKDCINYILNFRPLPVLSVRRNRNEELRMDGTNRQM